MKIILTQEVSGLGAPGDVVEVKDGYGRNYLLPRGEAIRWTKGAERTAEAIKAARASRAVRDADHATEIKAKLEANPVSVKVKAGQSGRLFGAVSNGDIAEAVKAAGGPELDKRKIEVKQAVKSLGSYEATVRLHADVAATLKFEVVPA